MTEHAFSQALEKTEIDVLTAILSILAGEIMILSKLAVKYLGITADMKVNFFGQIRNTAD